MQGGAVAALSELLRRRKAKQARGRFCLLSVCLDVLGEGARLVVTPLLGFHLLDDEQFYKDGVYPPV